MKLAWTHRFRTGRPLALSLFHSPVTGIGQEWLVSVRFRTGCTLLPEAGAKTSRGDLLFGLYMADSGVCGMLGGLYVALKVRYAEYGDWDSAACTWVFRVWVPYISHLAKLRPRNLLQISDVAVQGGQSQSEAIYSDPPITGIGQNWVTYVRKRYGITVHFRSRTNPFRSRSILDKAPQTPPSRGLRRRPAWSSAPRRPGHPRRRDTPDLHSRNDRLTVPSRKGSLKGNQGTFRYVLPFPAAAPYHAKYRPDTPVLGERR